MIKDCFGEEIAYGDVFLDMCDEQLYNNLPDRFALHILCDDSMYSGLFYSLGKPSLYLDQEFCSKYCVRVGRYL
jgi:hypothetical protein